MKDIKNNLTTGKNTKNIQVRKGKSFGYQVLGFGAGGGAADTWVSGMTATGGNTIYTIGDYKVHKFTGPGTFAVSALGCGSGGGTGGNIVDYIISGGGASGSRTGGGGGAGGMRFSQFFTCAPCRAVSAGGTVSATSYPIVIGGGGASVNSDGSLGNPGGGSSFLSLTSTGGGAASNFAYSNPAGSGGSGGGTAQGGGCGGAGNTPPVSPSQGFPGGTSAVAYCGGGGGGAAEAGGDQTLPAPTKGLGGNGLFWPTDALCGASAGEAGPAGFYFSGGGAGVNPGGALREGGLGGGGNGGDTPDTSATANTGGGGGGRLNCGTNANGGSGIVLIRYRIA